MSEQNPITKKLRAIQQEIKAPKSQWNDFSKFHYRSNEDILEALKPLLEKYECIILQTDKPILVGTWNYIEATSTLQDEEGNEITVTASAREQETIKGMSASQITGSASSYARKVSLGGLLAIGDAKDADSEDNRNQAKPATQKAGVGPATDKQRAFIKSLLEKKGIETEAMAQELEERFGIVPGHKLTKQDAAMVIEELQSDNKRGES